VGDAELGESVAEAAAGVGAAVVGSERQAVGLDSAGGHRMVDEVDRLLGAAAKLERPADDLAVQQSIAAFGYVQPCSATQPLVIGVERGRAER
jgi:hypothetical protein